MDEKTTTRADWTAYGIVCDPTLQARMDCALDTMMCLVRDLGAPELVQDVMHEALYRSCELPMRDAAFRCHYLRGGR